MLSIAICDDMPSDLQRAKDYTQAYLDENQIDARIQAFSHPNTLLAACRKEQFHIYLLDMVMPMLDGVELGVSIRRFDKEAQIIYITTEPEWALRSFTASPINYHVKPLQKEALYQTLNLALSKMTGTEQATFSVKSKEGLFVIPLGSILYCELKGHKAMFVLIDGRVIASSSLRIAFSEYIAPLLVDARFYQPHNSYVVNLSRVEHISNEAFLLQGGASIPIVKKLSKEARTAYLDYIFDKQE